MRRIHVDNVIPGRIALNRREAHHARDVLRLNSGQRVEVFDDQGRLAEAVVEIGATDVFVLIEGDIREPRVRFRWTVAAAPPKGARADWMIEKLSELGADRFIPLATARGVVRPEGSSKLQRWARLAGESAKQCRREGVMVIGQMIDLPGLLGQLAGPAWFLSTAGGALPMAAAIENLGDAAELTLLIGPEGGWTPDETAALEKAGLTGVSLGATILRVETAAVAAGAIIAALVATPYAARGVA